MLIGLPLAALTSALHAADSWGLYRTIGSLPLGIKLTAAFLANDVGAYWMHRLAHRSGFLWRFHSVHHSAEHLDWLVNTRAHPVDLILMRLGGLVPVYLLGLGAPTQGVFDPVVAGLMITGTAWSFFIHANLRWRLGPLEWLIATPAFHHWHHTKDCHRDRNFAALFPWLDRLFRTHYLPKGHPPGYGIDEPMAAALSEQFVAPFLGRKATATGG